MFLRVVLDHSILVFLAFVVLGFVSSVLANRLSGQIDLFMLSGMKNLDLINQLAPVTFREFKGQPLNTGLPSKLPPLNCCIACISSDALAAHVCCKLLTSFCC